jgi:hypothetical protein
VTHHLKRPGARLREAVVRTGRMRKFPLRETTLFAASGFEMFSPVERSPGV